MLAGGKKKQKRKKLKITTGEDNLKIYETIHKGPEGFKLFFLLQLPKSALASI